MLAVLKTIRDCAAAPADPELAGGTSDLGLSRDDAARLERLGRRLDEELFAPFFAMVELQRDDATWSEWTDRFRPLAHELAEEAGKILLVRHRAEIVTRRMEAGLERDRRVLEELSPALAHTFTRAVETGWDCEMALLKNAGSLQAIDLDPDVRDRRERAAIGFGLAFCLATEALRRVPADRERIRFLVLKLERMAAVIWVTTKDILETAHRS